MKPAWLILLVLVSAQEFKGSPKPSAVELAAITQRGRMLAEYDTAAWHATDAVMASHRKSEPSGRYIAHDTDAGWIVDFGHLNGAGSKFLVDHEATQAGIETPFVVRDFNPEREDLGWNLAAANGINTAMKDFGGTSRPYNVAVLPESAGGMYVYLYPAQVNADEYVVGADVRYHLSADGGKIIEKRRMHKSIITYAFKSSSETMAGGYHTHVLSDLPEDTDVLLVLTRRPRVPEFVAAGAYMFTIDVNGNIKVEDMPRLHR
jgi:hypothetical protein